MRRYPLGKQQRSHPEHQEREFTLSNDVHVHEDILVLNGAPHKNGAVDPPAVYYTVALRNDYAKTCARTEEQQPGARRQSASS